ncbi:MAG: DUF1080 domain-containing protein [Planctomycetales bacterium]|nr:DUF1080 domain-containing protein [Planctomycetales bacterium]
MQRIQLLLAIVLLFISQVSRAQEAAPVDDPKPVSNSESGAGKPQDNSQDASRNEGAKRERPGRSGGRGFRGGGRGGRSATPDDTTGFVLIFDGKSLDNWDGDPKFWSVQDGMIVGQSTDENRVPYNTFLIWRGEKLKDFELKLEVRLTGGNSGIQYRSRENDQRGKWSVGGYQADFDANNRFSGMLYGEQGGGFLAPRGNFMRRTAEGHRLIASLGNADDLATVYKPEDFNTFHIVAKGNTLLHFVNGRLLAGLIDEDENGGAYATEGILALQMHTGPPMKLEARNIWIKKLQ